MKRIELKNLKKLTLKKSFKLFGIILLAFSLFAISSCSRDDDPVDNDFFAGTYRGTISYRDGANQISKENGSVFVTKIGSNTRYNFRFSDGIPNLDNIEFKKDGDDKLVMIGGDATSYIRIDNKDLKIFYTSNGKLWTADAKR